jgi:tetratricopeptide (TPR) repeat protein
MMLKWLDAREATAAGAALADDFYLQSGSTLPRGRAKQAGKHPQGQELQNFLQKFLQRIDQATRPLKLNVFKRAKLANSFKWRLLEKGVEKELVDELTQALVVRLTPGAAAAPAPAASRLRTGKLGAKEAKALHQAGTENLNQGAYDEALACFEQLLRFDPRDAFAHNGAGIALARLARFAEAEDHLRRAIGIRESLPEAHFNLAGVLLTTGRFREAEMPLRRALKLKPDFLEARVTMGGTLVLIGRLPEARDSYEKALRAAPSDPVAIVGLGKIDALEGRFAEAEAAFRRALEIEPDAHYALAALAGLRRMTPADSNWVKRAEQVAASGLARYDEAALRFAIGKYYDDVGDFPQAFRSYQRGNELHRMAATRYSKETHARYVDDLVRTYTGEALAHAREGMSDSDRPVLVVGMPRSGTSLVEQIIASHPTAHGAGELEFWTGVVHKREQAVRSAMPGEAARHRLAREYLRVLDEHAPRASRIVDKAPMNADYLGLIHAVFPRARMIYLQRDPIDTCLSCYFQQFSAVLNFTMDLSDLADYYREHRRLIAHWRAALPPEVFLEVPYAELVTDQEKWIRRIIEFAGLPWDDRCLDFHKTARAVTTASSWQVRQKIYKTSVQRWRNYEKFIGPLRSLADLPP